MRCRVQRVNTVFNSKLRYSRATCHVHRDDCGDKSAIFPSRRNNCVAGPTCYDASRPHMPRRHSSLFYRSQHTNMDDNDDTKITMESLRADDNYARRSPSAERRAEIHRIELEDRAADTSWSSCCSRSGKTDKRLLNFSARLAMSILTLGFSAVQIARAEPCDNLVSWYCSIVSWVLGTWMGSSDSKTAPDKK